MIISGQLWLMICTYMYGCFIHHAPCGGFQGQYKQIANKQYEWTKRFIKSQLAGAEQLAIFKVQPKIEPWANENKSREYQDKRLERRNTKLQIQHPNYSVTRGNTKLQIQHPNYSVTSGNTKLQIQHPNYSVTSGNTKLQIQHPNYSVTLLLTS